MIVVPSHFLSQNPFRQIPPDGIADPIHRSEIWRAALQREGSPPFLTLMDLSFHTQCHKEL